MTVLYATVSNPSANNSIQTTGTRRPLKNRSVTQPEKNAPRMPPQGNTAYLNAAELTVVACTSFRWLTPQSVKPYRQASRRQRAMPTTQSAGFDRVRRTLFPNEEVLDRLAPARDSGGEKDLRGFFSSST